MIKTCKHCNTEFKCDKSNRIYCSKQCSTDATKKQVDYICIVCEKIFSDKSSAKRVVCSSECASKYLSEKHKGIKLWKYRDSKPLGTFNCLYCGEEKQIAQYRLRPEGNYCSQSCSAKHIGELKKENNTYKTGVNKACPICNKEFYVKPSQVERRITCSRECSALLVKQTGRLKGENNPAYGKDYNSIDKILINCRYCGKEILRSENYLNRIPNPCCSKSCHFNYLASIRNTYGENNPNWMGGLSFLPYSHKFNKQLKLKIKDLDGAVCVKCGRTEEEELQEFNKRLSIHHIDYDKQNCNEANLTVLCMRCNIAANYNKDYHIEFFKSKIQETRNQVSVA